MLRIIQSTSAKAAAAYYDEGLSKQDYYSEKGEIIGKWNGKAATLMVLEKDITRDDFEKLCNNINPVSDSQLTARNNDQRTIGYDINFHAPKSLSIIYGQTQDKDIETAFRSAVSDTMTEIEKSAQTRVRVGGSDSERTTGNLIWGEFLHTTSRPVDGVPDCHLHAHCYTFNATYDDVENKWKAGQFRNIKADAPYYEAIFHSKLTENLSKCGYNIERTANGWEVAGIERETIEKFSNRTKQIEEIAAEKNINNKAALDGLGAKTRASKRTGLTPEQLKETWENRLNETEKAAVMAAKGGLAIEKKKEISPEQALNKAIEHHLERTSVVDEKRLYATALKYGYGSFGSDELAKTAAQRTDFIKTETNGKTLLTTKEALNEEKQLVQYCREAKGNTKPINPTYQIQNDILSDEQKTAVYHALQTNDGVVVIEGGAGTGKTTLMKEIQGGIKASGKEIFAFAPSAEASRGVLKSEGFNEAETVSRLLIDENLQKSTKGNIIWIDEAGMLGNKQMNQLFAVAKTNNAKLILSGDVRQHAAVERGDALRIMKEFGGIQPMQVRKIQRQKNAKQYKEAVKLLSEDKIQKGFERLDKMGSIKEMSDAKTRNQAIAAEYLSTISERKGKEFKSALVVTPTHFENDAITQEIRSLLKERSKLSKEERFFPTQRNLGFTEAQKQDAVNFQVGHQVQFHQNVKGFKAGNIFSVKGKDEKGQVMLTDANGKEKALPLTESKNFQVYQKNDLIFSSGDKLRITQNGKSLEGKKLNNGQIYDIKGFTGDGDILLSNGATLSKNYQNFTHGYAVTSHSSQGKTTDKVIIAQSAASFAASSKQQFYVSVSRGRENVSIYTDDKDGLLEAVKRSADRMGAIELSRQRQEMQQPVENQKNIGRKVLSRVAGAAKEVYNKYQEMKQRANQEIPNEQPKRVITKRK